MLTITSDNTKVFKNTAMNSNGEERVWFNYSIATKLTDNNYDYMSKQIKFKRGEEPKETCNIKINSAFQSFYKKGEEKIDYLMVLDYEIIGEEKQESNSDFEFTLQDSDLPF